jgi:hypothetical protein
MNELGDNPPADFFISEQVIHADDLRSRVKTALSQIEPSSDSSGSVILHLNLLQQRAKHLNDLYHTISFPPLEKGEGIQGHLVLFIKRIVRRFTYWYVEPRWQAQSIIDKELADFALDTTEAIESIRQIVNHNIQWNEFVINELKSFYSNVENN